MWALCVSVRVQAGLWSQTFSQVIRNICRFDGSSINTYGSARTCCQYFSVRSLSYFKTEFDGLVFYFDYSRLKFNQVIELRWRVKSDVDFPNNHRDILRPTVNGEAAIIQVCDLPWAESLYSSDTEPFYHASVKDESRIISVSSSHPELDRFFDRQTISSLV